MGGMIAVTYAATYPKDVLSLLISAAPGVAARVTSDIDQLIDSGKLRDQSSIFSGPEIEF